jgi:hypothetical protein
MEKTVIHMCKMAKPSVSVLTDGVIKTTRL